MSLYRTFQSISTSVGTFVSLIRGLSRNFLKPNPENPLSKFFTHNTSAISRYFTNSYRVFFSVRAKWCRKILHTFVMTRTYYFINSYTRILGKNEKWVSENFTEIHHFSRRWRWRHVQKMPAKNFFSPLNVWSYNVFLWKMHSFGMAVAIYLDRN